MKFEDCEKVKPSDLKVGDRVIARNGFNGFHDSVAKINGDVIHITSSLECKSTDKDGSVYAGNFIYEAVDEDGWMINLRRVPVVASKPQNHDVGQPIVCKEVPLIVSTSGKNSDQPILLLNRLPDGTACVAIPRMDLPGAYGVSTFPPEIFDKEFKFVTR